ncbi:MAG TPA: signal recognition particle-docking protein FtsY [Spirochaetales bacterium]|nr:signal recognition particle-docking protein FtsY [Spirochaetales bacterium]HPS14895.1 signal recognition particle-docking protein FtsY [Spirochaetales bacterium]
MGFADKLKALFRRSTLDDEAYEDLADLLVEGDIGAAFAYELVESLKKKCRQEKISDMDGARRALKSLLLPYARSKPLELTEGKLNIVMLLGVNGVGKTTSCAKLAYWASKQLHSNKVILAAGDTFRAAAVDQLKIHGQRLGIRVVAQGQGADAAAVLWDSIDAANADGARLLVVDTAGRMHTRQDLIKELEKMNRIVAQKAPEACYSKILVLDATTGQNGMRQAEIFNAAVSLDGVILSKYDSTAKGGMILSLAKEYNLATMFLGTGEAYDDFEVFSPSRFLDELLGI